MEALCEDNVGSRPFARSCTDQYPQVDFVPTGIERVTPAGIETADGKLHELDILICATGFDITGHLPFDLIGRNGVTLESKYTPHPRTYLSVAVDGFPNWFQGLGPNSGVGAGSLLVVAERQVDYAVAATLKLQRERLKSIEAKPEAVADFDEYIDVSRSHRKSKGLTYSRRVISLRYGKIVLRFILLTIRALQTVFGEKCRSWYKAGKEEGRVVALWPGSLLAQEHPRCCSCSPRIMYTCRAHIGEPTLGGLHV